MLYIGIFFGVFWLGLEWFSYEEGKKKSLSLERVIFLVFGLVLSRVVNGRCWLFFFEGKFLEKLRVWGSGGGFVGN